MPRADSREIIEIGSATKTKNIVIGSSTRLRTIIALEAIKSTAMAFCKTLPILFTNKQINIYFQRSLPPIISTKC